MLALTPDQPMNERRMVPGHAEQETDGTKGGTKNV